MNITLRELGNVLGIQGLSNLRDSREQALFLFPLGLCVGGIVHREPETDEILLHPAFSVVTEDFGQLAALGPKQMLVFGKTRLTMLPSGVLFSSKEYIEIPVNTAVWREFFDSFCGSDSDDDDGDTDSDTDDGGHDDPVDKYDDQYPGV